MDANNANAANQLGLGGLGLAQGGQQLGVYANLQAHQRIWLIVPDNGLDGHEPPIAAYRLIAEAERVLGLLNVHGNRTFKLVELPLW